MSPQALAAYLEGCATDPETGRPLGRRSGMPIKAVVPVHLYGQVADMDRDPGDRAAVRLAGGRRCVPGARSGISVLERRLASRRDIRVRSGFQLLSRGRTSAPAAKPGR